MSTGNDIPAEGNRGANGGGTTGSNSGHLAGQFADADTQPVPRLPRVAALPCSPRARRAFDVLRRLTGRSAGDVAEVVSLMEGAGNQLKLMVCLSWIGIDAADWALVATGLGYAVVTPAVITCWCCHRTIGETEGRHIGRDNAGPHWLCSEHGYTSSAISAHELPNV